MLGQPLFGFSGSLILAVLILLLPDHILQSQDNRFYSQAFFCISVVLLLGGHVAVRRSAVAAVCLGPVAVLMVLTHSLTGLIWGFLLIGLLVDFLWAKQTDQNNNSRYQNNKSWKNRLSWKMILILGFLVTWSILLLVIAFVHIMPLAKSWNNFETSSVSPIHAVIGLGFSLGWFLFLLCVPAWLFVLGNSRQPGNSYWLVCAVASGISVFLLPLKIAYISHYNFLFTFPILVILSLFIDWLARLVIQSDLPYRKLLSPLLVIMVLLSNFPALASYYQDGGRYEWRAAYQFIREHWQPGDRIACFPLSANRYIPELEPKIPVRSKSETELQQIFDQNRNNRLWIPIACNRYEPDEKRRHWLYNNARYQTRFGKKRYDFTRNDIEIFLVQKTEEEY
ncbi:MAG: hypothetical protein LBQ50_08160 [Planctomycetaceae bacterium]|nr:hypothetical protein [Planctomycetaceae bacterium]